LTIIRPSIDFQFDTNRAAQMIAGCCQILAEINYQLGSPVGIELKKSVTNQASIGYPIVNWLVTDLASFDL
jgi:hypothetical protein